MAEKFLFSDPSLCLKKGQQSLALFAVTISLHSSAQTTLFADAQSLSSAGQLRASHWMSESLQPSSQTHWMAYHMDMGLTYAKNDWELELAKTRQGYLVGNGNALLLAAQDDAGMEINLSTPGRFSINAQTWVIDAYRLKFLYKFNLSDGLDFKVEPYLLQIQDYQHARGELTLLNETATNQLYGQLNRVGTRRYGYLMQDQPDAGWGMGLNLKWMWLSPVGRLETGIQNAFSQLKFSTLHYSDRQYQVQAQGGQIKVSDIPSLTGIYGLREQRESLPIVWQLLLSPTDFPGVRLGVVSMKNQERLFFKYERGLDKGRWWVQTVQADNWSAGLMWSFFHQLELGMAVSTTDQLRSPVLTSLQARMTW